MSPLRKVKLNYPLIDAHVRKCETMNDNPKKLRVMTAKRFATAKLSGKTTAEGFLEAHMLFLRNHTFLEPILDAYDGKQLLPTPTLQAIQSTLLTHMLESERHAEEEKLAARVEGKKRKPKSDSMVEEEETHTKAYTVVVTIKEYDRADLATLREGETWESDTFNQASTSADRFLAMNGDTVYATITNNLGVPVTTTVQRDDAIARFYKSKKGAVSRARGRSTKTLGFTPHAKQTRVTGPWSR
jgi:hypothetical protein